MTIHLVHEKGPVMPKSPTTGAATTRAHTGDPANPAAATSTAADISAAAHRRRNVRYRDLRGTRRRTSRPI